MFEIPTLTYQAHQKRFKGNGAGCAFRAQPERLNSTTTINEVPPGVSFTCLRLVHLSQQSQPAPLLWCFDVAHTTIPFCLSVTRKGNRSCIRCFPSISRTVGVLPLRTPDRGILCILVRSCVEFIRNHRQVIIWKHG